MHHCWVAGCGLALLLTAAAQAGDTVACPGKTIGTASVRTVVDGRTLVLTDGREVRLAGIEVPQRSDDDPASRAARAALDALVTGREVTLAQLGPETDRYGRMVALVKVSASADPSVQQALLAQGHARVAAHVGDAACAAGFLAAERPARAAGLGVWADPYYVINKAEDPAGVLAVWGRFTVVEGKVESVRESGGTIYMNFGRRWSDDFTVTILKRNERSFTAAGLNLKALSGRHVRVRGVIEERGGPWIEAVRPEQIEIAERN